MVPPQSLTDQCLLALTVGDPPTAIPSHLVLFPISATIIYMNRCPSEVQ